jgi:ParB family chromosome partitioning protein
MARKPVRRDIPFSSIRNTGALNVRKTDAAPIEPLAASIARRGVIQNLVVVETAKGEYDVAAGGRRWRAVALLVEQGRMNEQDKLPCLVVDGADATEVSLAENIAREAMSPADEARAFADLIDEGRGVEDVAAAFGVTERHVKARRRLGRLAAPVFAAFEKAEFSIEQAQAFATLDDHPRQEAVFEAWMRAHHWEKSAAAIRRMMTETRTPEGHRLAVLVGREAYEAAGGAVDEDLFGDEVFFRDRALLERLAQERLEAAADAETRQGWKWAGFMLELDYAALRGLGRVYPEEVELSDEDQARWDEIEAAMEDESLDEEVWEALEEEREALHDKTFVWSDAAKAVAGVLVHVAPDGTIAVERGLQRAEDVAAAKADEAGGAAAPAEADRVDDDGGARPEIVRAAFKVGEGGLEGPAAPAPTKTRRDPYSAALRDDLRQALKGALQIAVAEDPALARDLLEFEVVRRATELLGWSGGVLDLRLVDCSARVDHDGWSYGEAMAGLPAAELEAGALSPEDDRAAFRAFRSMPKSERDALLALGVARSVRAALPAEEGWETKALVAPTARLVEVARPELRRIWTPTRDNFLSRVPKVVLLDIVRATLGPDEERRLMAAKKGDLVDVLHAAFNDDAARSRLDPETRARLDAWTPEVVRHAPLPTAAEEDGETKGEPEAAAAADVAAPIAAE